MKRIELELEITPEQDTSIHYLINRLVSFLDKTEALDGIEQVIIRRLVLDNQSSTPNTEET